MSSNFENRIKGLENSILPKKPSGNNGKSAAEKEAESLLEGLGKLGRLAFRSAMRKNDLLSGNYSKEKFLEDFNSELRNLELKEIQNG